MADMHYFLLGAIIMVMISLPAVHNHEHDWSKDTKRGAGCDTYTATVQQCVKAANQFPPNADVAMMCRMLNESTACMAAAAATCDNPPAESKEWTDMWTDMDSSGQKICSHSPGDTSCGNFEAQAVTCMMVIMNYDGPSSLDQICRLFREVKLCMDPLITRCPDEAQGSELNSAWQFMEQQMPGMSC